MRRLIFIVVCLLVCIGVACENKPFEVISPTFRSDAGSALVSVEIPSFSRGLIQRVSIRVTSADTARIRTIRRDMNFPIPGGSLAVGQVTDIPVGKRRFTVTAFDNSDALRFRGFADSTITSGEREFVQVALARIGGTVNFRAIIDPEETDVDSATLASLPLTSVLDIFELIPQPHHPQLGMLPLASVGLGDRFTTLNGGLLSRFVRVEPIPTGFRNFVAHLKDLGSNGTRAFADTVRGVRVDTIEAARPIFVLEQVREKADLDEIFKMPILPPDSTVVVITPQF